ncbi:MAG TPA: hypothetical protein VFA09_24630 [Ktedonobacteraceae bacterium]|nr:hypothetical protein [Ktedonobacteraceae bacterium]
MKAFPYEQYETLAEPLTVYYPTGQEEFARRVFQSVEKAGKLLTQLLGQSMPEMEILVVAPQDWDSAPGEEQEETGAVLSLPYWTSVTQPPSLVVPQELDSIIGEPAQEKLAFLLYHELAHAFVEADPRPWPGESPLWADEWQLQFAAFWLFRQIHGGYGIIMTDLHEQYEEIFEPEPDGKTPVTVRGFDWYEDTSAEDYLIYTLLLERFADDILANFDVEVLPRFLNLYRKDRAILLSDEVTKMLGTALGPDGEEWLESLVYF